ncbi:hypothetical protein QTG54_016484 [Skeletonema marinoi]|uniref:Uncharacterized protein n=1 Tax=Skeletonema marinoi TaxID=267567 RepID=A0AAD8XSM0_9STRA|nr:hypothetical protein QTG54_016484 [Skeletonema marinoi]
MGSCTVGGLCDEKTQDLFALELRTLPTPQLSQMSWNFGYTDHDWAWKRQSLLDDNDYNNKGYDPDSSYGAIACVPKDGCDLSFNITLGSPVESYTVKKNGIQLDDRQEVGPEFLEKLMTPFGQNCSPTTPNKSLSGVAIAGVCMCRCCRCSSIWLGLV